MRGAAANNSPADNPGPDRPADLRSPRMPLWHNPCMARNWSAQIVRDAVYEELLHLSHRLIQGSSAVPERALRVPRSFSPTPSGL